MLKINYIKYISVSLLLSLMVGCQRPPLNSKNNNTTVQSIPSPIIQQKSDDWNLVLSAYSEFKKSIDKFNSDLQKVIDGKLEREELDFTNANKKLIPLKQALAKINNQDSSKSIDDINKTITDIENVIKPLEKGLNSSDVTKVQEIIKLQATQNTSPNGKFGNKTQIQLQKFLTDKNEILDEQFDKIKQLIKNQQKAVNTQIITNPNSQSLANNNPTTQDEIIISKSELDNIYKRLNLTVSVTISGFIILGGLFAWLLYKLNMAETKQNTHNSSNNQTKLGGIENYIEGEFTQIEQYLGNLDTRLKKLEIFSQNPQSPSLSTYTPKNNQSFNPPVNTAINNPKPQAGNVSPVQISNTETQIVAVYNNKPRSLSENAITVAESDYTVEQRRMGRTVAPILEQNQLGNYWIIQEGNNEYLVPKGSIKINEYNYETISSCFECLGYNPNYSSNFTLLKPAIVSFIGKNWQLIESGKLQFQSK
jgi:hypothetical protein